MSEAQECFAELKEVDESTFVRFFQWACNGESEPEDYTDILISHERVDIFAEKYDIQPLKALALDKLQGTLDSFWLYPERTGNISTLLKYVYANTGESMSSKAIRTIL